MPTAARWRASGKMVSQARPADNRTRDSFPRRPVDNRTRRGYHPDMDFVFDLVSRALAQADNRLAPDLAEPAFDAPLVGVSRADDPIWDRIVGHIGPPHWRPEEAFALAFPEALVATRALCIISWVLPQTKATRDEHRQARERPGKRWSLARHFGEQVNERLRRQVVARLEEQGIPAVAPVLLPQWDYGRSATAGIASNWSERHAAFAAGLGTFGLSDGLITARGKAVRVGSVVAAAPWPATPRPYGDDHRAYCLHFSGGRCTACAKRCPAGAIGPDGHDKEACKTFIRQVTAPWVADTQLGFPVNSCGFCQTGVPCEARIPKAHKA
jgi:epoxyqueuosine reductase